MLQQSEDHYKSLFFLNPSPMWVMDNETLRFLQVNRSAIQTYGYSEEEFMTMGIMDIKLEKDLPALYRDLNRSNTADTPLCIVAQHRRKNMQEFYVEVMFSKILFKGKPATLAILQDITPQMNYMKAIEARNEKLREIAWIQSHKVRGPLATILGFAQLYKEGMPDVQVDDIMQGILLAANKLDLVIRETVSNTTFYEVDDTFPINTVTAFPHIVDCNDPLTIVGPLGQGD